MAHPFNQVFQDLDLDQSLMVEALFVPNDLDGHHFARLVVAALQDLTERAFAQHVDDLVPIKDMVVWDNEVVASFVVVAKIVRRLVLSRHILLRSLADEEYFRVLQDLFFFVFGQAPSVK